MTVKIRRLNSLLQENGGADTPVQSGTPAAGEKPISELLAEGATNVLNLEERQPSQNFDPLNFSLDDFPLPPAIQTDFFESVAPAAVSQPQAAAEPTPAPNPPPAPQEQAKPAKAKPKKGFRNKLKNLLNYRLVVTRVGGMGEVSVEAEEEEESPAPPKTKPAKKKAPKKPRPKKAKKKKAAKKAPQKDGSSRKKLIIGLTAGGAILVGSIGAILLTRSWNQPARLMEKAQQYAADEQYEKAIATYEKLIENNELVPEAYLGLADSLVASNDLEGALGKLSVGYKETQDERLSQRLAELDPQIADEEGKAPAALSTEPIQWKDPAFERMVRLALNKPQGPISEGDLAGITNLKILGEDHASVEGNLYAINGVDGYTIGGVTYIQRGNITSLDDVVHFRDLTRLTVGYNQVRDISALQEMRGLTTVSLYANDITDLSPLKEVKTLKYLFLYNNHISDLAPLAELDQLVLLSLQYNQIRDISPLAGLTQLQELYISHNQIQDLTPLKKLERLTFLDASDNQISDLEPIAELEGLTDANFVGNPVSDYSPASHIQKLNHSFGKTR